MTYPTINIDLHDDRRIWTPRTVEVSVADVEERLIEQHGGLTDEEGNPLSPQVWYDAAAEIAQRRDQERRAG